MFYFTYSILVFIVEMYVWFWFAREDGETTEKGESRRTEERGAGEQGESPSAASTTRRKRKRKR
jgi:hypothetical protein